MKLRVLGLAIIGASFFSIPGKAQILNLDFTFTGHGAVDFPGGGGIVTGELFGLRDNATSLPDQVIVFSASTITQPYVFGPSYPSTGDGLTLDNGVVTGGNLYDGVQTTLFLVINGDFGDPGLNEFGNFLTGITSYNNGGMSAVTFSVDSPEPSTWFLFLAGAGGLFLHRRLRSSNKHGSKAIGFSSGGE